MSNESTGPVTAFELGAALSFLRCLSDRAQDNNQQTLHFVLSITADSLSDNLEMASDMDDGE